MSGMLTVIGEALVDLVQRPDQEAQAHPGGSPMNVAVGVSRLGHPVNFIGRWGQDAHGQMIEAHLRASQVQLPVAADGRPTSTAKALIGPSGAADYDFQIDWSLEAAQPQLEQILTQTSALHVGSIGAMVEPGASSVLEAVKAAAPQALISYDPNCRPSITPDAYQARQQAEAIVAHSDLVKASDEDLLWLYPNRTLEESAQAWLELGASMVVVTRGELGPWALTRKTSPDGIALPAYRVEVADTVGAGDSLMAALLAALLDRGIEGRKARAEIELLSREELKDILTFATVAAGITVSREGANPPGREELNRVLFPQEG